MPPKGVDLPASFPPLALPCCNPTEIKEKEKKRNQRKSSSALRGLWAITELRKRKNFAIGPISTQFSSRIHWEDGSLSKAYFEFLTGLPAAKKMFEDLLFKENLITGFYWKGEFLPVLSEMEALWWLEGNKQQGKLRQMKEKLNVELT